MQDSSRSLRLRLDKIKLDMSLTRGIHADHVRASLAGALVTFTRKTDAVLIAEGIETEEELTSLRQLGVRQGQGYLLGRPVPLEQALALAEAGARR